MKRLTRICLSLLIASGFCTTSRPLATFGQDVRREGPPASDVQEKPAKLDEPKIKPYDRVITKDAKTDAGIFTVHLVGDKYYYEIPKSELGREFIWVGQIAKTTFGAGPGEGFQTARLLRERVVKWERHGDRVLLRGVSYDIVADRTQPIARAVAAAINDTIIMAFNIEAVAPNDSLVIDVSRLFTTEVSELSARSRLSARGFDPSRSFIERIISFPENIEVEATHTFISPDPTPSRRFSDQTLPRAPVMSATVVMRYSMVRLPERPMMPRLYDDRVGYLNIHKLDFGQNEHRAAQRAYITRWRLDKKDPDQALSEPIKPIVLYVDPATPTKWVPFVKRGVEKWQEAFEEAGFKNAIVAREAPSREQDPDWSPEDARYSVIRWLASATENAFGPHVHDPRTGEILESDIQLHHNIMNFLRNWYFVQAGPLDPRAWKLPLPDDLMGQLIEFIVAHEVGHAIGFNENYKASSTYRLEDVRDREWVKKMGHTPSLMDYSRFNYVAQPEDNIDPADLIPKIGPYDKWATMWGYKPIVGARTPDEEKKTLDGWAREQDKTPWFRFTTDGYRGLDELREAVGDAEPVEATRLGLKNLERVAGMLLAATSQPGEPYKDLEELYGQTMMQWEFEMNHVAAIVGGFNSRQKHAGQDGVRFTVVPREKQAEAVRFLNEHAFTKPGWALRPEVLRRIEPVGALDRVRSSQKRVLTSLLSNARLARLIEQEAIDGAAAYRAIDFFKDLRGGIWHELERERVKVDPYRRNLQRAYLEEMAEKLNGERAVANDSRALIRGELRVLRAVVRRAMARTSDEMTRRHLEDVRDQIEKTLEPRFAPSTPASSVVTRGGSPRPSGQFVGAEGGDHALGCWREKSQDP